tara:strand:- start:351 stop:722 length:372 start_codon:yes stop_codon:yes gene_type:complete
VSNLNNKKIKVGYSTITIKEQSPEFYKDNMSDVYGQYLARESKIEIQPKLSDIDEANTLIHEILHASIWISSLSQSGQPLQNTNDEEVVVNSLSNKLTQIFIDNKWVLPYLVKKLNNGSTDSK